MKKVKIKVGGMLAPGGKFVIENGMLEFSGPNQPRLMIPLDSITGIGIGNASGMFKSGKGVLKFFGHGSVIGEIEMPYPWAKKAMKELSKYVNK